MSHDRNDGPSPGDVDQLERWSVSILDVVDTETGCFAAVLCWPCFWSYQPDMWINKPIYQSTNPIVPFEKLPKLDHDNSDCWNPTKYSWPI